MLGKPGFFRKQFFSSPEKTRFLFTAVYFRFFSRVTDNQEKLKSVLILSEKDCILDKHSASRSEMPPCRSRRIDGHFYPSAPEMPGICQSQAGISGKFSIC